MKRFIFFFFTLVLLTVVQFVFLPLVKFYDVVLDLFLCCVIYFSLMFPKNIFHIAFFYGLVEDVLTVYPLGANALAKLLLVLVITEISHYLDIENKLTQVLLVAFSTLVNYLFLFFLSRIFSFSFYFSWPNILISILYNSIFAPLLFILLTYYTHLLKKNVV